MIDGKAVRHARCATLCALLTALSGAGTGRASDELGTGVRLQVYPNIPAGSSGLLSLPAEVGSSRVPVVLLVHDSRGADARSHRYVNQLTAAGVAVYEVEIDANPPDGAAAPSLAEADALELVAGAAEAIRRHPDVDPSRVAVMGFGAGGRVALLASLRLGERTSFSARAILYPGCDSLHGASAGGSSVGRQPAPMLLMHGGDDPLNPGPACDRLAAELRPSAQTRLIRYEHATYGWDLPPSPHGGGLKEPVAVSADAVVVRPWPELADLSAAQVAGFFVLSLAGGREGP